MRPDICRVRLAPYSVLAIHAAAAIIFLLTGALYNKAQAQTEREVRLNKTIEERQKALMDLETKKEKVPKTPGPRLMYHQLKQDFEQMQVINNNLALAVSSARTLDYERIKMDVADIRKRAGRLQSNLSLPKPEETEKPKKNNEEELTPEVLKAKLQNLNSLIKGFVKNPVFQHIDVMNVGYSLQASRDLEDIIKLSEQINKRAEALSKATGKEL